MANRPNLELKQKQSLVMMPQLQQAIKMLQMSQADLLEFIKHELENNPLLEKADETQTPESKNDSDSDSETYAQNKENAKEEQNKSPQTNLESQKKQPSETGGNDTSRLEELHLGERQGENISQSELDTHTENLYDDPDGYAPIHNRDLSTGYSHSTGHEEFNRIENQAGNITLKEHLIEQIAIYGLSEIDYAIALYLIDQVNENGYITIEIEDVANRLNVEKNHIETILKKLQSLDPTGVMARSVQECLSLQLIEKKRFDSKIQILIENLNLLAQSNYKTLIKRCSVTSKELDDMIDTLKSLSPKPGLSFGEEISPTVIPDAIIQTHPDGGWKIELNTETLPKLLINMKYYNEVNHKSTQQTEKNFVSECHKNANWLIKSLNQRAQTILKVVTEIVKRQDAFLIYGITHLKPLNLKDVAQSINMHESTISRATANKYIETPRGVFEMKFFFSSSLTSSNDELKISTEAVKYHIQKIITEETVDSVLSDDKIVQHLQKTGVEIARRTVTKYREIMNIPSSAERKRKFKNK